MDTLSNPKRDQILKTGQQLFWKFGFRRVTVEEICREAGVSKMTFYKFFPNKQELASAILDKVFDESLMKIKMIRDEHESADKTLKKMLQMKSEGVHGISKEFIKDLYANPEWGMRSYLEEKTSMVYAEISRVYEKGKEEGWVRKDLNVPFLIQFIQKSIEMITKDELLNHFDSSEELVMEITNLFVYGISPHG
jgi:AcrR family transcriptional regulator